MNKERLVELLGHAEELVHGVEGFTSMSYGSGDPTMDHDTEGPVELRKILSEIRTLIEAD
jgi:hypothetical protein